MPKEILSCKIVQRELNFSCSKEIRNLKLVQRVYLFDKLIEEWNFSFGFVMPNSTNSWQTIVEAAEQVLPHDFLSGNVRILTEFYDQEECIASCTMKLFYE